MPRAPALRGGLPRSGASAQMARSAVGVLPEGMSQNRVPPRKGWCSFPLCQPQNAYHQQTDTIMSRAFHLGKGKKETMNFVCKSHERDGRYSFQGDSGV